MCDIEMTILSIKFPAERERLQRLIDADRGKSFTDRIRAVDGLLAVIAAFTGPDGIAKQTLRDQREAEFKERWRELARYGKLGS